MDCPHIFSQTYQSSLKNAIDFAGESKKGTRNDPQQDNYRESA
jgi:hypothetical protein